VSQYIEFRLRLPNRDKLIFPDVARRNVSRLSRQHNIELHSALFHHESDGRTRSGPAPVRFGGGHGLIRLYGLGREGIDLVETYGHEVTRLIAKSVDDEGFVAEERFYGRLNVQPTRKMQTYYIRSMIIKKSGRHRDIVQVSKAGNPNAIEIVDRVEWMVSQQLEHDANAFGCGPAVDILTRYLGADSITDVPIHADGIHGIALKGARIAMDARLSGPWAVGYLRSRGMGALLRAREPAVVSSAA
jgi:hypothetical protein